jgi:peptidoglycan-associated lipoprotein
MARRKGTLGLVGFLALGLLACGGPKRPPAVTGPPPPPPEDTSSGAGSLNPANPVDWGPDIEPVGGDGDLSSTYLGDEYGEGGPLADIYFEYDRSTLSAEAQSTLEHHAQWLLRYSSAKVIIEGHCDERGTVEYNLALGDQRGRATMEYLLSLGLPRERMTVVSMGKERPVDPGHSDAAWSKNRRAHFQVSR